MAQLGKNDWFYARRFSETRWEFLLSVRLWKALFEQPTYLTRDGFHKTDEEPFLVTVRILEQFCVAAKRNGDVPMILLFPMFDDLKAIEAGRPVRYAPLADWLRAHGVPFIDTAEAFRLVRRQVAVTSFIGPSWHYTVAGNELVGAYVAEQLKDDVESARGGLRD